MATADQRDPISTLLLWGGAILIGVCLLPYGEYRANNGDQKTREFRLRLGLPISPSLTAHWSGSESGEITENGQTRGWTTNSSFAFNVHYVSWSMLCGALGVAAH